MARRRKRTNPGKGPAFERALCGEISEWWTLGKSDDLFWRSATSGGRATTRWKKNKRTIGHYGDMAATDPLGKALLKVITWEMKNGYPTVSIMTLIDCPRQNVLQVWSKWHLKASASRDAAGAYSWAIVHRRKGRAKVIYHPLSLFKDLREVGAFKYAIPCLTFKGGDIEPVFATSFDNWIASVRPAHIHRLIAEKDL